MFCGVNDRKFAFSRHEQFESFFDGNPKVAQVMTSIGMTGAPEISVFGSIDAPGTV
jgi:hypothetical protein